MRSRFWSGGPLAARAQTGLEASRNVWVLGNAAYMLQSQYNLSVQRGARNLRAAELAERYFERAKALDPKLDRQKILPQLPSRERRGAGSAGPRREVPRCCRLTHSRNCRRRWPGIARP